MSTSGSISARPARRLPALVAALACTVGALAVLQLSGSDADATTPPACETTSVALGAATGWTEFVEGNGTRGSESEGSVAYGGNLNPGGNTMPVGSSLPSNTPASTPTLVVAGSHGPFNLAIGSAWVVPQNNVNFNGDQGSPRWLSANPIDFAAAFAHLRATSTAWGAVAATGTVTSGVVSGSQPAWILTGTDAQLNVFSMTAAQLAQNKRIVYDFPASSAVIINVVDSGAVAITGNDLWVKVGNDTQQTADGNKSAFRGVIWNLPNATSLTLSTGGAFGGSVLAPNAAVNVAGPSHTIGQMMVKSFTSGVETHPNDFLEGPCLPPTTPPSPGAADLKITKTASVASPQGGDTVTYTLVVQNVGNAAATGVVATDVLPSGVTFDSASSGCSFAAGTVTCTVGNLAAGASATYWIKVVANPVAGAGPVSHPQANHWLTPYKVEQQLDLEPGQIRSMSLSCATAGDIVSDGSVRLDHVDQGTGHLRDLTVLSSRTTALGTWEAVVQNPNTGRAQGKLFIVCLPKETEAADRQTGYTDSHRHPLSADPALVTTTAAYANGPHTATLTCPTGTVPIAPGFALTGGAATLGASEYDESSPRDWRFTLDVTSPTTATFSARCLRTTVGPVYGHTHELRFTHVVKTFSVSGHTAKEGDEFQVICPDDAKGVVATWDVPPGLRHFGNDPRLKERAFRVFNDTGHAENVVLDLLCLRDRTSTEGMGTSDPVVVTNSAVVTSTSADANGANNSSTVAITVQPGSATTGIVGSGQLSGQMFSLRVASSMPGRGALTVKSGGALLAKGSMTLKPGGAAKANLKLTWAGRAQLGKLDRVTVRVDPTRGKATSRSVRVLR